MIEKWSNRLTVRQAFILGALLFGSIVTIYAFLFAVVLKSPVIFGSFWEAGRAASAGQNPYLLYPNVWIPANVDPPIPEINLNPPSILPLFQIFALFDLVSGRLGWLAISAVVYCLSVWTIYRLGNPSPIQIFWLFLSPLALTNLALGQIYALLLALGVAIWQCLRSDRRLLASLLIGVVVALKPNFAVWGFLAFASRHHREAMVAGAVALILSAFPAIFYGPAVFGQWMAAAALDRHNLFPHDVSLYGFFYRLGVPYIASSPVAALCLGTLFWAYRTRPSLYDVTPIAIIVGMLCSPIAWIDYIIVIGPFIVDRKWEFPMLMAALLVFLESLWVGFVYSERTILGLVSILSMSPALIMFAVFLKRARTPQPSGMPQSQTGLI